MRTNYVSYVLTIVKEEQKGAYGLHDINISGYIYMFVRFLHLHHLEFSSNLPLFVPRFFFYRAHDFIPRAL